MQRQLVTIETLCDIIDCGAPYSKEEPPSLMEARLAQMILGQILGPEVTEQLCLSTATDRRFIAARRYLRMDRTVEDSDLHSLTRFVRFSWLSEALYNMQAIDGIEKVIDDITHGDLQAAWEELAFGMLLIQREVPFRFVPPSTVQGEKRHDMEIELDGITIACEVEGKSEETDYSDKSVYNTLEHARKQLPKDKPGLIYLKLPEIWKGHPVFPGVFVTIDRFFKRTKRVVAVIVRNERHSHKMDEPESPEAAATLILRTNPYSDMLTSEVQAVLDHIWNASGRLGGTPLQAVATAMILLNTARANLLEMENPPYDWPNARAMILAELREELAKENPSFIRL